jgi:hypothetical protein
MKPMITYQPKKRMIPVCAQLGPRRGYGFSELEATVELLILTIFGYTYL